MQVPWVTWEDVLNSCEREREGEREEGGHKGEGG